MLETVAAPNYHRHRKGENHQQRNPTKCQNIHKCLKARIHSAFTIIRQSFPPKHDFAMKPASPFTPQERFESFKVAILGAGSAGLIAGGLWLGHRLWQQASPMLPYGFSSLAGLTLLVSWAIASLSGALFALTYRYAIRQNQNPQLNAGVVLAFALVRGLAQVDAGSAIAQQFWPFGVACIESLILFSGTAILLNGAFRWQWVKPFGQAEPRYGSNSDGE